MENLRKIAEKGKNSAEDRIRTGELLREQILSLSPLTRLGNFGLDGDMHTHY